MSLLVYSFLRFSMKYVIVDFEEQYLSLKLVANKLFTCSKNSKNPQINTWAKARIICRRKEAVSLVDTFLTAF